MIIPHFPHQGSEPGRTPVRVSWENSPFAERTIGKAYRDYNWNGVPRSDDLIIIDYIRMNDALPSSPPVRCCLFRVQGIPIWDEGGVLLQVQFVDEVERK